MFPLQVNDANKEKFVAWSKDFPSIQIISDGSTTNDNRSGAVSCIHLVVKQAAINDDLMVIAGYVSSLFYTLKVSPYRLILSSQASAVTPLRHFIVHCTGTLCFIKTLV